VTLAVTTISGHFTGMGNTAIIQLLRDPRLVAKFQSYCGVQIVIPPKQEGGDVSKLYKQANGYVDSGSYNIVNHTTTRLFGRHRTVRIHTSKLKSPDDPSPKITVQTMTFIDLFFRFATELGYEPFYITVVPFFLWNIDSFVGRQAVLLWCVSMYMGQALKPLIRWPRPASPPVLRLEFNPILEQEYGFPSTHAIVSTILPFYTVYLTYNRYEVGNCTVNCLV